MILKYVVSENIDNMNDFQTECYIDNIQFEDQSINTVKQAIHILIDKENDYSILNEIIEYLVRDLGKNRSVEKRILETTYSIEL